MNTSSMLAWCAALAVLLPVAQLQGQPPASEVRVRLANEAGQPVAGALVTLVDTAGKSVAEGLSGETGTRVFRVARGVYRVHVRRIGFRPFASDPITLPVSGDLSVRVESAPVFLQEVVVTGRTQCRQMDRDAEALSTLWDEVAKALRATQLAAADLADIERARVYRKEVRTDGTVVSADTSFRSIGSRRPFGAVNPAMLASTGYVIGNEETGWTHFGVDETTLLSNEFIATHCFRAVRDPQRPDHIGLAFEPVARRQVADVGGVLWLDQETSELRELIYHYRNAGLLSRFGGGGYTRFQRTPSGAWLVDQWWLRMPLLERRPMRQGQALPGTSASEVVVAVGHVEHGGDLVRREVDD